MATLEDGQSIEQYQIMRLLGSGLAGECYEAEDTVQLRKVTLKLVHPWSRLSESARRQFFREMQGISGLNHPYLANVLDYGESGNLLYIARRYVSTGSLLSQQARSWFPFPLAPAAAILYAHQLAQALQSIHSQGYIHGSLTLSNILVLRGPNLDNVSDFAPFLLADVGTTNFVRRFGQPPQTTFPLTFAPEQLGGRLIAASDQYALAVLLCLWLTGRPPFMGSAEEVEYHKLTATIPSLHQLNTQITLRQEGMLRRALSVYPDERYPSILAFSEALVASLDTPPHAMRTEQPSTPTPHNGVIHTMPSSAITLAEYSVAPQLIAENTPTPIAVPQASDSIQMPTTTSVASQPEAQEDSLPAAEQTSLSPTEVPISESTPQPYLLAYFAQATAPQVFHLISDTLTLGRAGSSDIILDQDGSISRHHALLKREQTGYTIYDQRSTLGVLINGNALPEGIGHVLTPQDQVTIGAYTLILQWRTA